MNKFSPICCAGLILSAAACSDGTHPVDRVTIPARGEVDARRIEYVREKPMPDPQIERDMPLPPFDDMPLVSQRTPEQARFEQMYRAVGKPRITVFVNRTLEGEIVPLNPREALVAVEKTRQADSAMTIERKTGQHRYSPSGESHKEGTDKFESKGPGQYRETTEVYLKPGQYDEVYAKSLDYQAMENILTDFLACQGTVEIMSPTMVRQKLTDQQIKDLQSGKPTVLREIAQQLETDVLVQVTAHPTRQTQYGLEVRLVGEAFNVKGGQQLGRAVVDVQPPLEKTTLNRYTRFVARKLMMDLTQSWGNSDPRPAENPGNKPPEKSPNP